MIDAFNILGFNLQDIGSGGGIITVKYLFWVFPWVTNIDIQTVHSLV